MNPYQEIDVSFDTKESEITLDGTLTLPLAADAHASVILISGSGPLDRDSTILNHKPFRVIADYLTRKGIAVLRFDKRGVGKSTGDFNTATTEDFAQDVSAAIEYLKSLKEIDPQKIGLIGYSEGGFIASMTASRSEDVAFVVMLAGPALPIKENGALLFTLLVHEDKPNLKEFNRYKTLFERFFNLVTNKTLTPKEQKEALEIAQKTLPLINEKSKAPLGFTQITPEVFITIFSRIPSIQEFLNSNPESFLKKIQCPVLAIYGSKDVQVPPKENIQAMKTILTTSNHSDYTLKEIPDANHLFQNCKTGYPSEYQHIKNTMSSEVLSLISDWISDRT